VALTDYHQLNSSEKSPLALPLSPYLLAKRLTTLWTLKESYVKATGEGIVFGLENINVEMDDSGTVWGVGVEGKDVGQAEGWGWDYGFFEDGRPEKADVDADIPNTVGAQDRHGSIDEAKGSVEYGWAVYWRDDTDGFKTSRDETGRKKLDLESVQWADFLKFFS